MPRLMRTSPAGRDIKRRDFLAICTIGGSCYVLSTLPGDPANCQRTIVHHGRQADAPRPPATSVVWVGDVRPRNARNSDAWFVAPPAAPTIWNQEVPSTGCHESQST